MVLYLITRQIDPFFKSIAAYILLNLARISERFSRLKNDIIEDVPWGTHFCQFYQTKEDLMETLIPYFKAGLENNELCFWVTSQALEVEEAIEALRRVIPDFDVCLEKGQIEIIPCNYWCKRRCFQFRENFKWLGRKTQSSSGKWLRWAEVGRKFFLDGKRGLG